MRNILCLLIGGILFGCSDHYLNNELVHIAKKEQIGTTHLMTLPQNEIYGANGYLKQGNKLIVGTAYMQESVAKVFDIEHQLKEVMPPKMESALKVSRILSSFNSFDGQSVTALDFRTGELLETSISPVTRSGAQESVIQLPKEEQHLVAVKTNDFIISTGLYEKGRYLLYSLADGSCQYYLSYPDCMGYHNIKEQTKGILYASGILRVRPDGKAFVCADMYSGLLDFCRLTDQGIERVRLERLSYPKTEILETPVVSVIYSSSNYLGFMDVAVTQERIYALYSGKTYERNRGSAFACNCLLEYDWEGNLIQRFDFDVALTRITYDYDEGLLYGITDDTEISLVRLNL